MSGSFAKIQTVKGDAEADDQQHARTQSKQPLPLDGFGELSLDPIVSELNFAVAGFDRHPSLDLVGSGMLGAIEVRPAHLARVEEDQVEPGLLPLRCVAFEASCRQFGVAAETQR